MISIIISSYQPTFFAALEKNIAETIGVPYEILQIYNPGTMGICEAYNMGAQQAKYDNLLFIHEDILFHTHNWGEKLISHLQDPETGIIGVAGSDYVPVAPSGWYVKGHNFMHILQNNKKGDNCCLFNSTSQTKHKVIALDGVFLAMSKQKLSNLSFNEAIKGYHGYDLDISLRSSLKFTNYVISDILVEHFSPGTDEKTWFDAIVKVRRNLGSQFNYIRDSKLEQEMFYIFMSQYIGYYGVSCRTIITTLEFFPVRIKLKDQIAIAKKLMYYYIYRNSYNLKKTHE